jgi:fumarylacetoacetase
MSAIDHTHDPELTSWIVSANDSITDFPIQNLPFGRFLIEGDSDWRIGVAIGDHVLDLRGAGVINFSDMNRLIRLNPQARRELRAHISAGLTSGSAQETHWAQHVYMQAEVEIGLPCEIHDYTDFYIGIHHATAVGKLFRPDNPLLPNYEWVPIGYHGRASTLQASGQDFHRPQGQIKLPDATTPMLSPSRKLDLELELGFVIGRPNAIGHPIALSDAEDHLFGVTLFNDWSARDIQAWEYQPLGPFLSKSFFSTLSPWMVTLEALAPFRTSLRRPAGHPEPLPYLSSEQNQRHGALDIGLEVLLQTQSMRDSGLAPDVISRSNVADASFWTPAQLVAHHTVNGCALSSGDLFGSGTLSGPSRQQAGSLLEMTEGGKHPIQLSNGESRTFLEDGDRITLRGRCARDGYRSIGFGDCSATVLPSIG